jgi:hypothetical protein
MAFYSSESKKCHFHFPHGLLLLSQKVRERLFASREAKIAVSASLTDQLLAAQVIDPGAHARAR